MLLQAYGAALVIIFASVVLGHAICSLCIGDRRAWAAPAVGLVSLIILSAAAIKLPGHATTAVVIVAAVLVAAAALLVRRRLLRVPRAGLVVSALPVLAASLPFVASGRVGLLGVGLNNDTQTHLLLAEALRSSKMAALWGTGNGYPLGPHSLVATVGTAAGFPLDMVFTGLLVAIVPITALVAAGVLPQAALWRRAIVGLMCSIPYLFAAYYAEGAFKEMIMAALLLAFVVHLSQVGPEWREARGTARWRLLVPAVLLAAGAVYTYSYVGMAWFGLSIALWAAAVLAGRPTVLRGWLSSQRLSAEAGWIAGAAALAAVVILPVAGQTISFFRAVGASASGSGAIPAGALGNLIGRLSPYEMLGIWTSADFRRTPADVFHAGELSAFALAVLIYGFLWSLRRGKLLLPAAAAACLLIWWRADRTQSPYVSAKALVIAAPLMMALALRALLTPRRGSLSVRALGLTVAALFCAFAAYSSYQVLRNEPVEAPEAGNELAAFHSRIGDSAVLFLGDDDYAPWQLRAAAVSALASNTRSLGGATARANKPYVYAQALDFDSVTPRDLDNFRYVITSDTPYASEPPANFQLLARSRLYDLWLRTGHTVPRSVFEPSGAPGAILDCRSPLGQKLRAARGVASIMSTPVTVPGRGLLAGGSIALSVPLPRGEWELSIQYVSSFVVELSAQGRHWTMPAYLGRPGPFFAVGSVSGAGASSPVTLTITALRPSRLTGTGDLLFTSVPVIAFTRIPDSRQLVPLRQACGKYVDWYRLS
jgi:hypothetical protein